MSLRTIALALVFCLAGCTAEAGEDFRPKGTEAASYEAKILVVHGAAAVRIGAQEHPAKPGFQLARTDVLVVKPGGLLVLRLHNDYVVTVDEDLTLPVKDLAMLDAPIASRSVADQLDTLAQRGDITERDRVIGFPQAKRAAESGAETEGAAEKSKSSGAQPESKKEQRLPPPPQVQAPAPAAPAKGASFERPREESAPAPAATAAAQPRRTAADVKDRSGGASTMERDDLSGAPGGGAGPIWTVRRGGAIALQRGPLPAALARALQNAGTCLARAIPEGARLSLHGKETLRLHVVRGKVVRIALGSGLPAPTCLDTLKVELAGFGADGVIELEVPLP